MQSFRAEERRLGDLASHGLAVVLALGVALIAVAPALSVPGLVATRAGGDSPFLLQRTFSMAELLRRAEFPPRWMPEAAYGLGYPFWNFYGPLAYLWAGLLALLSGSVVGAVKVAVATTFVVAALGMYALAWRTWASRAAAFLASAAYTLVPYHLVNLYVRGDALGELAGYACLPWLLVAIDAVAEGGSMAAVAAVGLATAALLTSHNVTAMLALPLIAAFAPWRCLTAGRRRERPGQVWNSGWQGCSRWARPAGVSARVSMPLGGPASWPVAITYRALWALERWTWPLRRLRRPLQFVLVIFGLVLGGGLAAWFWLPALAERSAVQLGANLTGYFHYANHFRGLDVLDWHPIFDYRAHSGGTLAPCRLGLLQLFLAALGGLVLWRRPKWRREAGFWTVVALVAAWMVTPLSRPIWGAPGIEAWLSFAQFPWRWLSIVGLATGMLSGGVGTLGRGWPVALLAALGLVLSSLLGVSVLPLAVDQVTEADLVTFEVFSGNIGSTVRAEYLPRSVVPRPWSSITAVTGSPGAPVALRGQVEAGHRLAVKGASSEWSVMVVSPEGALVAFPVLWFPGSEARLDGGRWQPTTAMSGSGWVQLEVPPGSHTVALRLGRSDVRAVAEVLSLAAWLMWLILLLARRGQPWLRSLVFLALSIALAAVLAQRLPVGEASGPVTLDFVSRPYPHFNPGGVPFGSARLVRAMVGGVQPVPAGQRIVVDLEWQSPDPDGSVELALVAPAAINPELGAPDVRALASAKAEERMTMAVEVPRDVPTGLYFLRLRVHQADRLVPASDELGQEVGDLYLGPVRVRGGQPFWESSGGPVATMGPLSLLAVQPVQEGDRLEVRMVWQAGRRLASNYKTSVRLTDATGRLVAQRDAEPLYGYLPTSAWQVGEQVRDRRWLSLPPDTPPGADYLITVVAYDEATGEELGRGVVSGVRLDGVPTNHSQAGAPSPAADGSTPYAPKRTSGARDH